MSAPKVRTVGVREAKTRLSALLKNIGREREIVITKRGRPVARLVPIIAPKERSDVYNRILAFHGRIVLPKGETTKDLINAGRRI